MPFFWSQHYDVTHQLRRPRRELGPHRRRRRASRQRDCTVALFRAGGKTLAVATIGRDHDSLEAELAFEHGDPDALASLGV